MAVHTEKRMKTASKSAYKRQSNACSNYAPIEGTARRPRSVTTTTKKLETKHRPIKDNAYRQDIVTRTPITQEELINISTVDKRSIWHNSAADFLRFWKFPPQICESRGATYRRNYETFIALLSTSGPLTNTENSVQTDA